MKIRILFFTAILICLSITSQIWAEDSAFNDSTQHNKRALNFEYTISAAEKSISMKEYDTALYILINLFPVDSVRVVNKVMELDSLFDLPKEIQKAFVITSIYDTEIFQLSNGTLNGNMDMMKIKGGWADDLIRAVKEIKRKREEKQK